MGCKHGDKDAMRLYPKGNPTATRWAPGTAYTPGVIGQVSTPGVIKIRWDPGDNPLCKPPKMWFQEKRLPMKRTSGKETKGQIQPDQKGRYGWSENRVVWNSTQNSTGWDSSISWSGNRILRRKWRRCRTWRDIEVPGQNKRDSIVEEMISVESVYARPKTDQDSWR